MISVASRRRCMTVSPRPCEGPNRRRSLGFVPDVFSWDRRFRVLAVVGDFIRQLLVVDRSIPGARVVHDLEARVAWRGAPPMIASDTGTALTPRADMPQIPVRSARVSVDVRAGQPMVVDVGDARRSFSFRAPSSRVELFVFQLFPSPEEAECSVLLTVNSALWLEIDGVAGFGSAVGSRRSPATAIGSSSRRRCSHGAAGESARNGERGQPTRAAIPGVCALPGCPRPSRP